MFESKKSINKKLLSTLQKCLETRRWKHLLDSGVPTTVSGLRYRQNLAVIGSITFFLILSGCAVSETERSAKPPVVDFMSETRNDVTPQPLSPFEKCLASEKGVRYVITGESVDSVSLTWENDSGETDQGDYEVPFCMLYSGFESGGFLYISAQIIRPTSGAGSIKCYIYDGDSAIAEASANGFASIATCTASAK